MEKQGPTVENMELYSTSRDKPQWKRMLKKNVYVYKTESLLCTAEVGTTLEINHTSIKILKKRDEV